MRRTTEILDNLGANTMPSPPIRILDNLGANTMSSTASSSVPSGARPLIEYLGGNAHTYENITIGGEGFTSNGTIQSLIVNYNYPSSDFTYIVLFLVGIFLITNLTHLHVKKSTNSTNNDVSNKDVFTDAEITKSLEDRSNFTVNDKDFTDTDITKYFANKEGYIGISDNSLDKNNSTCFSENSLDSTNFIDTDVETVIDFTKNLDIHPLSQIFSDITMSNSDIFLVIFLTSLTSIFWFLILKFYVMKQKN